MFRKSGELPAYLIFGLGNPGKEYAWTRHNAGYLIADALLKGAGSAKKIKARLGSGAEIKLPGKRVVIIKPATYMNKSGDAVKYFMRQYAITEPERILVLVDEVSLPLGKVRLRPKGSAGGHNGLRSIIEALGGQENFPRLRFGIGPGPDKELETFVLEEFTAKEKPLILPAIEKAGQAVACWLDKGMQGAMNRFNA